MTYRETFNLAAALQSLAIIAYPAEDETGYPNAEIALEMGKIAALCLKVKLKCLDLDPTIKELR